MITTVVTASHWSPVSSVQGGVSVTRGSRLSGAVPDLGPENELLFQRLALPSMLGELGAPAKYCFIKKR